MIKKNKNTIIISIIFIILILVIIILIINYKNKSNYIYLNKIDNYGDVNQYKDELFEKGYIGSKSYDKLITKTIKKSIGSKKYKSLSENKEQSLFDIGDIMAQTAYYDIEEPDLLRNTYTSAGPRELFGTTLRAALNLAKLSLVVTKRGSILPGIRALDIPRMQLLVPQFRVLDVMPFNTGYNLSGILTSLGGLIAKVPDSNIHICSFRGTSNLSDVIEDVKFIPMPFGDIFFGQNAQVHSGFANTFGGPRTDPDLLSPLLIFKNWVLSLPEIPEDDFMFYCSGHSLGGAEALLATSLFLKERPRYRDRIITHTYGAPESIIMNIIGIDSLRYLITSKKVFMWQNSKDPIPRLSKIGEFFGYSSPSEILPEEVSSLVKFKFEPQLGAPVIKYHSVKNYVQYLEEEVEKEDIELQ